MSNIDSTFQDFEFSVKADKPISDFSNWIFGISVGMCALLIFQMQNLEVDKYCFTKLIYILLVILSMINLLFVGYTKYLIFKRDIGMGVKYGAFKKSVILSEKHKGSPEFETEKTNALKYVEEYLVEYNKITKVSKFLNISIWTTISTVILTGIFIIFLLIFES